MKALVAVLARDEFKARELGPFVTAAKTLAERVVGDSIDDEGKKMHSVVYLFQCGVGRRVRQGTLGISTNATVRHVISHHNCFSGIFGATMSDSVIEENVSVRNAVNSGAASCGGNCIVNSHNNHIRRNQFSGNGSVGPPANDFGVGLNGNSSGNVIEDNSIGGNTNGVSIQANAVDNVIRRNVIAGNPPSQVSRTFGALIGFDVKDESAVPGSGSRNTIERNWCVTYSGPGPFPCPNFPGPGPSDNK